MILKAGIIFICLLCGKIFIVISKVQASEEKFVYFYRVNANLERRVGIVEHFQETVGKCRKARKKRKNRKIGPI